MVSSEHDFKKRYEEACLFFAISLEEEIER
jgi:hypothetical protein